MNLRKTLLVAVTVMAAQASYAQYLADVLRFSQLQNSSTARIDATGGFKSSIGGDLSSLYGNPAGLGMFSKSEFGFTPSLKLRNNDISITGQNQNNNSSNLDFNNIGVVFHSKVYKKGDLKKGLISLNFGIGYQKKNAFKNDFLYTNQTAQTTPNTSNGLGDYFAETATQEGKTQNNLTSQVNGAAYDSRLITEDTNNPTIYYPLTALDANQIQTVNRSGGSSSVDFSMGANISNNVFIGASLGLASFKYLSFEQTNENYNTQSLKYNVDYNRNFDTNGSGVNLKLGMILKPVNSLRIGLTFESPTWYTISDNYSEELNNKSANISGIDSYPFDYQLRTPAKVNGGLSYFFGNNGFISADVGFVDYSTIKFTSNDATTSSNTNRAVKQNYQNVINYNIGGEVKIQSNLLLRAGYQLQGNPYKNTNNSDFEVKSYSGGLGYRFGNQFLDLTLINSNNKLYYRNYVLSDNSEPVSTVKTRNNTIALTYGVRF
ncbi:outer membrane protein transport protein [Pelobium sp.]|nr:outer membrane protein transport protein [Pelobium sp.]MDA9555327.1 outer membrane protein transport protein [Pelobium sp.]